MAGDFRVVKSLVGDTYEISYGIADEALEEGDICNFDADGELEKVGDNADEQDLVIVLADAAIDETNVPYVWLDPWILIEGTAKGTVGDVGDFQSIDVTTNVITVEATSTAGLERFQLREIVDATAKTVRVTRVMGAIS